MNTKQIECLSPATVDAIVLIKHRLLCIDEGVDNSHTWALMMEKDLATATQPLHRKTIVLQSVLLNLVRKEEDNLCSAHRRSLLELEMDMIQKHMHRLEIYPVSSTVEYIVGLDPERSN